MKKLWCMLFVLLSATIVKAESALVFSVNSIIVYPISCDGVTRPVATGSFSASGGQPPYTYFIDGSIVANSNDFTIDEPGDHTFMIRDSSPLPQSVEAVIDVGPSEFANIFISTVQAPCSGQSNGVIEVTTFGQPQATRLTKPDGSVTKLANDSGRVLFTGLAAGMYRLDIGDRFYNELYAFYKKFCTSTTPRCFTTKATVSLVDSNPLVINQITSTAVSSPGGGTITVTADGGAGLITYRLNDDPATEQPENIFTGLQAGQYKVTVGQNVRAGTTVCDVSRNIEVPA